MASHKKELIIRKPSNRLKYIKANKESSICPLCNKPIKKSSCPHSIVEITEWWNTERIKATMEMSY
jgi:uncharacterized protein with PIN domain